jgi:hypothetical protein
MLKGGRDGGADGWLPILAASPSGSCVAPRLTLLAAVVALIFLVCLLAPLPAQAWCVGGAPPALDEDGDDLNDLQEAFFGTDPNNPDTDGNGVLDSCEDSDGDGVLNKDEPTIFSLEGFVDPFADLDRNNALVIEGTNLFNGDCPGASVCVGAPSDVIFTAAGESVHVKPTGKYNNQARIYLLLTPADAAVLEGPLKVATAVGETNTLSFMPMHCHPGPPMLMAAALMQLKLPISPYRDYVAIGGCNLIEREGTTTYARTVVRLADHDILIRAPYGGMGMLPSRVMLPAHSLAKPDPAHPFSDDLHVGDLVGIVTSAGESNAVPVAPPLAQLRFPPIDLTEDHDMDGLTSGEELTFGTDPLLYDTDRDGVSDGRELQKGTDPLDPTSF